MCEIRVSNGLVKPAECAGEQGRGYILMYPRGLRVIKGLVPQAVDAAVAREPQPLLSVCHQRVPSVGSVSPDNVQPFADRGRLAFCHNGTLTMESVELMRRLVRRVPADASDSRLLWELIKHWPFTESVRLLRALAAAGNHRFVLADAKRGQVALIGPWSCSDGVWDRGRYVLPGRPAYDYALLDRSGNIVECSMREAVTLRWPLAPRRVWEL